MELARQHPWLTKRGNVYYLRAKVPADIAHLYPKREVKRSLKTGDRTAALRLIHSAAERLSLEFDGYRQSVPPKSEGSAQLEGNHLEPRPAQQMTTSDIERIVGEEWRFLAEWADAPTLHLDPNTIDEMLQMHFGDLAGVHLDAQEGRALQRAISEIKGRGFVYDPDDAAKVLKLSDLLVRAHSEAILRRIDRLKGDFSERAHDRYFDRFENTEREQQAKRAFEKPAVSRKTLNEVITLYENDHTRKDIRSKTRNEDARTFAILREVLGGETDIAAIGRSKCVDFQQAILAMPKNAQQRCKGMTLKQTIEFADQNRLPLLSPKGANKYIHKLSALMNFAISRELKVGPNPAARLAAKQKHTIDDRNPFLESELRSIFLSSKSLEAFADRAVLGRSAVFWVPLLGVLLGLRLGEACQLQAADFLKEREVWCLRLAADEDSGTDHQRMLKTANAWRTVPVHSALIRLGLSALVEHAGRSKSGKLFPEIARGSDGYFSPFSKSYSRFLKQIGVKTKKTSFHSFRHNFRDALEREAVPEAIIDYLGGWSDARKGSGARYGTRPSVSRLQTEIEKLSYEFLSTKPFNQFLAEVT